MRKENLFIFEDISNTLRRQIENTMINTFSEYRINKTYSIQYINNTVETVLYNFIQENEYRLASILDAYGREILNYKTLFPYAAIRGIQIDTEIYAEYIYKINTDTIILHKPKYKVKNTTVKYDEDEKRLIIQVEILYYTDRQDKTSKILVIQEDGTIQEYKTILTRYTIILNNTNLIHEDEEKKLFKTAMEY